jgi:hypothetical protein
LDACRAIGNSDRRTSRHLYPRYEVARPASQELHNKAPTALCSPLGAAPSARPSVRGGPFLLTVLREFTGRSNQLGESMFSPGVEIRSCINREFACLTERGASADASVFRERRGDTGNAIDFSDVARGFHATHVARKKSLSCGLVLDFYHCDFSAFDGHCGESSADAGRVLGESRHFHVEVSQFQASASTERLCIADHEPHFPIAQAY